MALNCGIVGLPNVGKSTIFSALTSTPAEAANYPFCTIEPNIGIVNVPDPRLDKIAQLIPTAKVIPATTQFVDIAGLVAGASKGEGLGNKFLANIREVGVIAHVVRCFEDPDIIHVNNKIDPASDIETIDIELCLADYDTVDRRFQKDSKLAKVNHSKDLLALLPIYQRLLDGLSQGQSARSIITDPDQRALISDLHLITLKPVIYVCNIDEASIGAPNPHVQTVQSIAARTNSSVISICGKAEAEIADLDSAEERAEFLSALGLTESGMNALIREAYSTLGLRTFFTAGPDEDRAWTFKSGSKAPQAAGIIHTDFQRGFIKAEVYNCQDLFTYGSESKVKEAGKLRIEGKDYLVQDGDIMFFKFNV